MWSYSSSSFASLWNSSVFDSWLTRIRSSLLQADAMINKADRKVLIVMHTKAGRYLSYNYCTKVSSSSRDCKTFAFVYDWYNKFHQKGMSWENIDVIVGRRWFDRKTETRIWIEKRCCLKNKNFEKSQIKLLKQKEKKNFKPCMTTGVKDQWKWHGSDGSFPAKMLNRPNDLPMNQ